jgi:pimeloyl-ACP methyl ester carboxylesterase
MGKPWLVFGGWAIPPQILRPVFGEKSVYLDINEMMPLLFDDEKLIENWVDIVNNNIAEYLTNDIVGIAGWSTGAIMACRLAQKVLMKKLVLFSGTPSFCKREGFRFGQRPIIIQTMIRKLKEKENTILRDFMLQCGLQEDKIITKVYDKQTLVKGLMFLEKANLIGALKKTECEALVVHGRGDKVIPYQAGEALAEMIGAEFVSCSGGHAFFAEHATEVKKIVIG